jgi:hypothetical protein
MCRVSVIVLAVTPVRAVFSSLFPQAFAKFGAHTVYAIPGTFSFSSIAQHAQPTRVTTSPQEIRLIVARKSWTETKSSLLKSETAPEPKSRSSNINGLTQF